MSSEVKCRSGWSSSITRSNIVAGRREGRKGEGEGKRGAGGDGGRREVYRRGEGKGGGGKGEGGNGRRSTEKTESGDRAQFLSRP